MLLESFVSFTHGTLSGEEFGRIEKGIQSMYEMPSITKNDFDALLELMRNDKKNKGSAILMCKLDKIGDCSFDFEVPDGVIKEALSHYFKS